MRCLVCAGAGTCFLVFALNPGRHKCLLLGFRANGSFVNAVFLVDCSGYHVAAFSVVFRFFRLGASLRQRAVTKKQAPAPSYLAVAFQRLLLRFNMKCEVPCNRVISYAGNFFVYSNKVIRRYAMRQRAAGGGCLAEA